MRKQYANHCTKQLCEDETQNRAPTNASRERFDEGDQRIEMRAADTAKRKDQREQAASGRGGIREQCQGGIAVGKPLSHDARADDSREQKRGAERFCNQLARAATHSSHR